MKVEAIFVAIFLSIATNESAFALTGDELLATCSSEGSANEKQCKGYILGVVDGAGALTTSMRLLHPESGSYPKLFCAETATPNEMERATKAYLLKNPGPRRFNAASEVMLALQQAFPCSK